METKVVKQKYLWNGKSKVACDFGLGRIRVTTLQNYKINHNIINEKREIKFCIGKCKEMEKLMGIRWSQIELGLMQR